MDIFILNSDLERVGVIDYCASIIWTRRYCEAGDFELYVPATEEALELLQPGNIAMREDLTTSLMLIQNIQLTTDAESGNYITATGQGIEAYIARRIIWSQTNLSGTIAEAIAQLLNENLISPTDESRKISGITLGDLTAGDTQSLKKQITGDNLLDGIIGILKTYKLGFSVDFEDGVLAFNIYEGTDRSYNQSANPYVVFSPEFDNFINSDYTYETTDYKNVALVAGEGEGSARRRQAIGDVSGIERREIYVDARDISSTTEEGTISSADYLMLLKERGEESLAEAVTAETYEGEVEPNTSFIFGEDYNLGDVVETINSYGQAMACRISEIIENWDENGRNTIPTFTTVEGGE